MSESDFGGIRAGDGLIVDTHTFFGNVTKFMLTDEVECFHGHDEPVLEKDGELYTLFARSPKLILVPLRERLEYLQAHGAEWSAIRPRWVMEPELGMWKPEQIAAWRSAVSAEWLKMEGADYAEMNLLRIARHILAKYNPFRWLKRVAFIPGPSGSRLSVLADVRAQENLVSFHCTEAMLDGYQRSAVLPWIPPSLAHVHGKRRTPKKVEVSIRADDWAFAGGHLALYKRIYCAEEKP